MEKSDSDSVFPPAIDTLRSPPMPHGDALLEANVIGSVGVGCESCQKSTAAGCWLMVGWWDHT